MPMSDSSPRHHLCRSVEANVSQEESVLYLYVGEIHFARTCRSAVAVAVGHAERARRKQRCSTVWTVKYSCFSCKVVSRKATT